MTPAVITGFGMGMDTLEEEEEKSRFFAQLEAGASSTIDYSKLNRELDLTSSTITTNLRYVSSPAVLCPYCTKGQEQFSGIDTW